MTGLDCKLITKRATEEDAPEVDSDAGGDEISELEEEELDKFVEITGEE